MAVRVRCSDCKKQIAVDDAFAGSMCRCPYCKSIVMVPPKDEIESIDSRTSRPQKRPDKPGKYRPKKKRGLFATINRRKSGHNVTGAAPIIGKDDVPIPRIIPGRNNVEQPGRVRPPRDEKASTGGTVSAGNKPAGLPIVGGSGLRGTIRPPAKDPEVISESDKADALANLAGSGLGGEFTELPEEAIPQAIHVDASELSEDELAAIPTANPVRTHEILSLILITVLVIVAAICIYFWVL